MLGRLRQSDPSKSHQPPPSDQSPPQFLEPVSTPTPGSTSAPLPKPVPTPEAQDSVPMDTTETPPLPTNLVPVVPSPPVDSLAASDPKPKAPPPAPMPPLADEARKYIEAMRRQAAFTHTLGFQELLSQGLSQASPQRNLFRHPASAFGTLPPPQGPPPLPALPAPRKAPPASRLPRLVSADPSAKRKEKPTAAPIELEDSEEDSAHTTPPGSEERDGSGNQSDSDPPLIPLRPESVTMQSSGRAQVTSRPKQKSSKEPMLDKEQPSKRPKK